jgi:hypothetical protein
MHAVGMTQIETAQAISPTLLSWKYYGEASPRTAHTRPQTAKTPKTKIAFSKFPSQTSFSLLHPHPHPTARTDERIRNSNPQTLTPFPPIRTPPPMSPHDGDDDGAGDDEGLLFAGVRFALVGFDPVTESQVRPASPRRDSVPFRFDFLADSARFDPSLSPGGSPVFGSTGRIWCGAAAPTLAGTARRGAPTWSSAALST